jgi:hypothetical protein
MSWTLYDYIDNRGRNSIKDWAKTLEKEERARLNAKLDMLAKNGPNLALGLLTDTRLPHIKKIKVKGRVQVRLMLSRGPIDNNKEFTLLFGATEKGFRLIPEDADYRAETRRQEILQNTNNRRCPHERL